MGEELERKVVRHVATAAGVAYYDQPLGTVIVAGQPLVGLTWIGSRGSGHNRVDVLRGSNGRHYEVSKDSGDHPFVIRDASTKQEIVREKTQNAALRALERYAAAAVSSPAAQAARDRAAARRAARRNGETPPEPVVAAPTIPTDMPDGVEFYGFDSYSFPIFRVGKDERRYVLKEHFENNEISYEVANPDSNLSVGYWRNKRDAYRGMLNDAEAMRWIDDFLTTNYPDVSYSDGSFNATRGGMVTANGEQYEIFNVGNGQWNVLRHTFATLGEAFGWITGDSRRIPESPIFVPAHDPTEKRKVPGPKLFYRLGKVYKDVKEGKREVGHVDFSEMPPYNTPLDDPNISPDIIAFVTDTFDRDDLAGFTTRVDFEQSSISENRLYIHGSIYNPNGHRCGYFERALRSEGGVMTNAHLTIDQSVQGQGFAEAFYDWTEDKVAQQGFRQVVIQANIDVGGYAWARRGFDWDTRETDSYEFSRLLPQIYRMLDWYETQPNANQSVIRQLRAWLPSEYGGPITNTPHPWELASLGESEHTWEETLGNGKVVPMWLGKKIMLGTNWNGVKPIGRPAEGFTKDIFSDWRGRVRARMVDTSDWVPGYYENAEKSDYNVMWADLFLGPEGMENKMGAPTNPVDTLTDLLSRFVGDYEEKAFRRGVRHVRTPQGMRWFREPMNAVIRRDPMDPKVPQERVDAEIMHRLITTGSRGFRNPNRAVRVRTSADQFNPRERRVIRSVFTHTVSKGEHAGKTWKYSPEEMSNLVRETYKRSDDDSIKFGMSWYQDAHDYAQELADEFDLPLEVTAGAIAAMSPGTLWPANKTIARNIIVKVKSGKWDDLTPAEMADVAHIGKKRDAAQAVEIIRTGSLYREDGSLILTGYKRQSFVNNMVDPQGEYDVTVDTWMLNMLQSSHFLPESVLMGWFGRHSNAAKPDKAGNTTNIYSMMYVLMADVIRDIAAENGILPNQLQAIIWEQLRKEGERNETGQVHMLPSDESVARAKREATRAKREAARQAREARNA